ncbi:carbonic anhydrase [Microbulbifer donghaiensis]|uniref:Carbonic anhydrase n=1 Tax=Microbulbifer donghaiensis TaxID=494016 RepID=A0A1M4YT24_9GAMM|nr:carbonate dehydratase [Microbulbifer donghaiensis]SHF08878.1 carbonic anhydrase [Microbulbifer donghaiensis]
MAEIDRVFLKNREWASACLREDPNYFTRLAEQQAPKYLWIGCSDSRVPANQIVGMAPGELFVHRNIANLVIHTDLNCLSVLQYAVDVLGVEHVVVCGHYGCGGVRAAMGHDECGLVDNWLRNIKEVYAKNATDLDAMNERDRLVRLCELNVIEQVQNLAKTKTVQHAWDRGQKLSLHGWIYDIGDGLIRDLGVRTDDRSGVPSIYHVYENPQAQEPLPIKVA